MLDRASTMRTAERREIFVSYSRHDVSWLERLRLHLMPMIERDRLEIWHDGMIQPGDRWLTELHEAVARARVAVLLVSPDYLASPFIAREELAPLLRAAETEGLRIFWVPVRASVADKTELGTMQAAQPPDKPLAGLRGAAVDRALASIARAIVEVFEEPGDAGSFASTFVEVQSPRAQSQHGQAQQPMSIPFTSEQVTVGRAVGNDVVLDDDETSRWHAVFERFGAHWYLRDLTSRNGTTVNGERVGSERRLQPGDHIRIGRTSLVFHTEAASMEANTTRVGEAPPDLNLHQRRVLVELARPLASGSPSAEPASDRELAPTLGLTEDEVRDIVAELMTTFDVADGPARRTRLADAAIRRGAIDAAAFNDPTGAE